MRLGLGAVAALTIVFAAADASALVINTVLSPLWSVFNGGGTTRTTDVVNDNVKLTTANATGIWFGNGDAIGGGLTASWDVGTAASGNYLSLTANLSSNARDWHAYMYDRSGYYAEFGMNVTSPTCNGNVTNCYTAPVVSELTIVYGGVGNTVQRLNFALDVALTHTYEFLLKNGQVFYRVDGDLLFSGAAYRAVSPSYPGLLIIGDGSGTTRTGNGWMNVTAINYDNAPNANALEDLVGIPAPGALGLMVFGLLGLGARRNWVPMGRTASLRQTRKALPSVPAEQLVT